MSTAEAVRVREVTPDEAAMAATTRIGPITHVFIAGPLTHGDQAANVRAAMDAAQALMEAGLYPYLPHLSWFSHLASPQPYEEWLSLSLGWLKRCDAVLRLPGYSPGAERECSMATFLGIPVFRDFSALLEQAAVQR